MKPQSNSPTLNPKNPPHPKAQFLHLFFGGLLPVIAFTLIEEKYGTWWGLVAGMVFGGGEIVWELVRYRKVSTLTWSGNALLLGLGFISIWTDDGLWFKLQPAIFEFVFVLLLWGSLLIHKPLLTILAQAQGQQLPDFVVKHFPGLTFRLGIFFAIHCGLATWAAFSWSSEAWALLKGLGLTISFIVYMVFEILILRRSISNRDKISTVSDKPAKR